MHAYLPAIGFGQIKKKSQLQQLLSSVQNFPDQVQKIRLDEHKHNGLTHTCREVRRSD